MTEQLLTAGDIQKFTVKILTGAGLSGLVRISKNAAGYLGEGDTNASSFPSGGQIIAGTDFGTIAVAELNKSGVSHILYWCIELGGVVDFRFTTK